MKTKTGAIREALEAGDMAKALSIASKFFDKSEDTKLYKLAASAALSPTFYRELGEDPDAIVEHAYQNLIERFS